MSFDTNYVRGVIAVIFFLVLTVLSQPLQCTAPDSVGITLDPYNDNLPSQRDNFIRTIIMILWHIFPGKNKGMRT